MPPSREQLPSVAELRGRATLVLVHDDFRYGGNVWPREVGSRRQLWRLGEEWFVACPERESLVRLEVRGADDDACRRAITAFGGFEVDDHGHAVPDVHDEGDGRWHQGTVFVRDPGGHSTPVARPDDVAPGDEVLPERIVWGERERRYALGRGQVSVPPTSWHALHVSADASAPIGQPVGLAASAPGTTCFVLLTATGDPGEPLWRALSRLVWAAWRAPSRWRDVRRGPPLRDSPAVAVSPSGHRAYGVRAADAQHAAEVADGFGVHWIASCAAEEPFDDQPLVVVHDGTVVAAGTARRAPAEPPAEGDALWDDEHFAGGRPVDGVGLSLPDAVAETRSAIAFEERLLR
jgi:hypothetical protein